ncbi:hypothetical protein Tco_0200209 [Tanacetum coccineum]
MAQKNYVEGCSMKRPPLLEADRFCFRKTHFETYIKSKDIDLWEVIQNGDFVFMMEDPETKMEVETTYEQLKDNEKKQLGKNNEAKMTLCNALPRYSQVKDCKIDLVTQLYEKFSISSKETIDSCFTRFNAIVTSLKSLDQDYSSKNHVRKFLCALPLIWRANVMTIEEAKDLATLSLDELISNLKVYELILVNDDVAYYTTKENVKSLALKAKVIGEQNSDDSDRVIDSEEAAKMVLEIEAPKFKTKADSEDDNEPQQDAICLMVIDSQEVCLKCDLGPGDWIMDSGCTKHMTGNRRLFTTYKEYDGGHVVFGTT